MSFKRIFSFLLPVCLLLSTAFGATAQEAEQHATVEHATEEHGEGKKKLDVAGEVFSHVGDSHEWHIFGYESNGEEHAVAFPLPIIMYDATNGLQIFSSHKFNFHHWHPIEGTKIKRTESVDGYHLEREIKENIIADNGDKVYDFSITKNVLCMLISILILLPLVLNVAKKYKKNGAMKAPSGFQNALEPVITFIRDDVAKPNLGHKYMKFMPLLLTLFFFIWMNNLLGLLPLGFNFTGNIAVTLCLALVFFIVMLVNANKHFWGHLFNPPGVPMGINVMLVIIEVISLFVKPIALTIRLFANMLAGHILILSVIFMIFIFGNMSAGAGWGFSVVSMAFAIFMFFLELLVAAIQAFIFTNLTAVFIGQAIDEGHGHEDGQAHHVSENEIIA